MSKVLTIEKLRLLVTGIDHLEKQDFASLVETFPFYSLASISILNYELMRVHLQLLIKFSKNELFYRSTQAVKCSLEFTLTNLLSLENVCVDDILFNLLELLKQIISKIKTIEEFKPDLVKNRERTFDILTFTAKLKIFGKVHVRNCTIVLCDLLMMPERLPMTTSRSLAEIAEIFKGLKAIHELAVISNVVLKKFTLSAEVFNVCISWLLVYGPSYLEEEHMEEDTLLELLIAMNEFCTKYGYLKNRKRPPTTKLFQTFEEFISNVVKTSERLIGLSSKEKLRNDSLKLFSFLFSDYTCKEIGMNEKQPVVLSKLLELPVDVKGWPHVKSHIFFYVCSFLYTQSRLVWSSSEILKSISTLIYSYDRFSIDSNLLKTLCHLYPLIMTDCLDKTTILLGDELLTIVTKRPSVVKEIQTYDLEQLFWILKRGDYSLKKQVLCQWLRRDKEMDILGKAILRCNVRNLLLDILLDSDSDQLVKDKATEMSHRIQDEVLSANIATMIPVALHHETVLHRLILSNPGMPESRELSLKLCEFMSLILFSIVDEKVLKAACGYCRYLVTNLKREKDIVTLFCQDMDNIKFLAIKIKYVSEETAAEILRLFKILILVQKRNHNLMDETLEEDLSESLVGAQIKTEKCLDLLLFIVTSKGVFINLSPSSIRNTFLNLFALSQEPNFAVRSLTCLTGIMKSNTWLAELYSTCLFIEVQCSLKVDEKAGHQFLTFLSTWMNIFKTSTKDCAYYVPDKRTIANYVQRIDFIPETLVTNLLRKIRKLKIYPDNSVPNARKFTHNLFCLKYDKTS